MIDLTKFCSQDATRFNIQEPFSKGEWTYATNGHICIRVPMLHVPAFPEKKEAPDCERIFNKAEERGPYEWVPVPEVQVEIVMCDDCKGSGKERVGQLKGYGIACFECFGVGHYPKCQPVTFPLGSPPSQTIHLSNIYLDLIRKELPNPQIGLTVKAASIRSGITPVKIKFDGGEGLLMPMRIKEGGEL